MQESEPGLAFVLKTIDLDSESQDRLTLFAPTEAAFKNTASYFQTLHSSSFEDVRSSR